MLYCNVMLDFSQMLLRLAAALVLGAFMGLEREAAGKEAGIRTGMLVAGGAAIFCIIAFSLPSAEQNVAYNVIANIVIGIGFLGGGLIIKNAEHIHGLTTAADVWTMAGVGMLAGVGLIEFAAAATLIITAILFILRKLGIYELVNPKKIFSSRKS